MPPDQVPGNQQADEQQPDEVEYDLDEEEPVNGSKDGAKMTPKKEEVQTLVVPEVALVGLIAKDLQPWQIKTPRFSAEGTQGKLRALGDALPEMWEDACAASGGNEGTQLGYVLVKINKPPTAHQSVAMSDFHVLLIGTEEPCIYGTNAGWPHESNIISLIYELRTLKPDARIMYEPEGSRFSQDMAKAGILATDVEPTELADAVLAYRGSDRGKETPLQLLKVAPPLASGPPNSPRLFFMNGPTTRALRILYEPLRLECKVPIYIRGIGDGTICFFRTFPRFPRYKGSLNYFWL